MRDRRRPRRSRRAAHSAAGGSRRANAHGGGAAAGSEGNRGGGRRPPVDGRVLAKLLQPPANRLLRRPRGDAVAQRFDRARTGRVANRQCAAAHDDGAARLAVAAASAAIGAVAVVCARVANARPRRKTMIVALARKLLVALWKYVAQGVVPEGVIVKPGSAGAPA